MNLEYSHLLDPEFDPASRVWVYQSSRLFLLSEALEIEAMLKAFTEQWNTHGAKVKAEGHLFFGQFIVLIADETSAGVSGCSTDSSVRFIKNIEQRFSVNLFDRLGLAFFKNEKVQILPFPHLQYAHENEFITKDTLYFNNLVQTKRELEQNWIIPVKDSWLAKKIPAIVATG